MGNQNVKFENIILKKHHYWRNLLIILFIALIIAGSWYYLGNIVIQPSSEQGTTTTSTIKSAPSLIEDENYVQEKMDEYLENNPNANEEYARDVVYLNIAREEKNPEICDKIMDSELKYFCSNAVR